MSNPGIVYFSSFPQSEANATPPLPHIWKLIRKKQSCKVYKTGRCTAALNSKINPPAHESIKLKYIKPNREALGKAWMSPEYQRNNELCFFFFSSRKPRTMTFLPPMRASSMTEITQLREETMQPHITPLPRLPRASLRRDGCSNKDAVKWICVCARANVCACADTQRFCAALRQKAD